MPPRSTNCKGMIEGFDIGHDIQTQKDESENRDVAEKVPNTFYPCDFENRDDGREND